METGQVSALAWTGRIVPFRGRGDCLTTGRRAGSGWGCGGVNYLTAMETLRDRALRCQQRAGRNLSRWVKPVLDWVPRREGGRGTMLCACRCSGGTERADLPCLWCTWLAVTFQLRLGRRYEGFEPEADLAGEKPLP